MWHETLGGLPCGWIRTSRFQADWFRWAWLAYKGLWGVSYGEESRIEIVISKGENVSSASRKYDIIKALLLVNLQ